jgi:uncharacterized protein (DUF736 family)
MEFFNRNAGAMQAIAAMLTVLLALAALIGVKMQIDAADKIQRAQSARDIYREYLNLAINKPEFANPDYCKIAGTTQEAGYEHFVEYMLYTAEQTISVDANWADTFTQSFQNHKQYICSLDDPSAYAETVATLVATFRDANCKAVQPCS